MLLLYLDATKSVGGQKLVGGTVQEHMGGVCPWTHHTRGWFPWSALELPEVGEMMILLRGQVLTLGCSHGREVNGRGQRCVGSIYLQPGQGIRSQIG